MIKMVNFRLCVFCSIIFFTLVQSYCNQDWHRDRHVDQQIKVESTEMNPYSYD